jgi:hypothetical protein
MPKLLDPIGTIYPEQTAILRHVWIDGLKDEAGHQFEVSTHISTGAPIIRSKQTGLYFVLRWTELLKLAKSSGIEEGAKDDETDRDNERLFV